MNIRMPVIFLSIFFIPTHTFKLGIENISLATIAHITKKNPKNLKIGLITNQTGKTQDGTRSIDYLIQNKIPLCTLFTAEHGINGTVLAGKSVQNDIDEKTGLSVISLYQHEHKKIIEPEKFEGFDLIIFDMQDVGMRHYTYISTLYRVLEAIAHAKIPLLVCDRPNLLGGNMEGPLVEKNLHSFISIAPIPLRHGMTIGELALFFNKKILPVHANLFVLSMAEYSRDVQPKKELLAPLSPNITSLKSAHGYSFLGLLSEIRPFDVGVGTSQAFQKIGLPSGTVTESCWKEAQTILSSHGIESSFSQYTRGTQNKPYEGLDLHIPNITSVRSFSLLMALVSLFQTHNVELGFSPSFDKAMGTSLVREGFLTKKSHAKTSSLIKRNIIHFYNNADGCFLYKPYPTIKMSALQMPPLTGYTMFQCLQIHA